MELNNLPSYPEYLQIESRVLAYKKSKNASSESSHHNVRFECAGTRKFITD